MGKPLEEMEKTIQDVFAIPQNVLLPEDTSHKVDSLQLEARENEMRDAFETKKKYYEEVSRR